MSLPTLKFIDYAEFNGMCFALAEKLSGKEYDWIVEISRGGAVAARILSDFLDIPILTVGIKSYHGIGEQGVVEIFQPLAVEIQGKRVLLVDEICDSGKTFVAALKHIEGLMPKKIDTAVLHVKPHSIFKPDFMVEETSDWVVYPYELRETVKALRNYWSVDEDLKSRLGEYFVRCGLSEKQLGDMFA